MPPDDVNRPIDPALDAAAWLRKAEGDLFSAERELAATERVNLDSACFHAQQCVEKLLKASLVSIGRVPPKTHDLSALLDLIQSLRPGWNIDRAMLITLTQAAVEARYPGYGVTRAEAEAAVVFARSCWDRYRDQI